MTSYTVELNGKVVGTRTSKNVYTHAIVETINGKSFVVAYSGSKQNAIKRANQQMNYRLDRHCSSYNPFAVIEVVEVKS